MVQLLSAFVSLLSVVAVSGAAIPAAAAPAIEAVAVAGDVELTVEPTVQTTGDFQAEACQYTCGTVCYTSSAITAALNKGYGYYKAGTQVGSSMFFLFFPFLPSIFFFHNNTNEPPPTTDKYPHQYNNYEGFNFPTAKPWYEFPILSSGAVYTGGSPGADRVIFDSKGALDMLITHTGASGNNFVACK